MANSHERYTKKTERETEKGHLVNVFEMGAEATSDLRKRIEQSDGLIRIFIHPSFGEYLQGIERDKAQGVNCYPDAIDLNTAKLIFEKIVSSDSPSAPPVFLFLSVADRESYGDPNIDKKLYVVPTEKFSPSPITPEFPIDKIKNEFLSNTEARQQREKTGWPRLITLLKNLGTRRIIIGGNELYVDKEDQNHGGCLGEAIQRLREHFATEISAITWPEGRKELSKN